MSTEARYLEIISGRRRGIAAGAARAILTAAVPGYAAAIGIRNTLYQSHCLAPVRAACPVVSVGNLTAGGTGKTPVVASVVESLRKRRLDPGIASRGYQSLSDATNDEFRVLQRLCPGTPHRQNRDRVRAARELVATDHANVIVLDDGFQHRRLARDLDIVLIDATNPWGFGHLLPRGLLREPKHELRRAHLIIITRAEQVSDDSLTMLQSEISKLSNAPIVVSSFMPRTLLSRSGESRPVDILAGRKTVPFCGIGNPQAFLRTLISLGPRLEREALLAFPDHHPYSAKDLQCIASVAVDARAEFVICTLKDLVKLPPQLPDGMPEVFALDIAFRTLHGHRDWEHQLDGIAEAVHRDPA